MTDSKSIPINPAPQIPKAVLQTCKTLRTAGYTAWLAGGCARDMLLGRQARDWDVVTNAPLEKIKELFPKHLEVGAAFGIIKLPPLENSKDAPVQIDIAIFRKESGYSDLRHPDKVEPGDEKSDVARRDFTVNAMYFDPEKNTIIDHVGGHKDLTGKLLRTVGDPSERFSEDALRILRAVRFSAQLGFKIDRPTAHALKKHASLLKAISRERVREELIRLFTTTRPIMGLEAIAQNGLWEQVFGVRRVSLPADLRQLRLPWAPTPLQWLCALGVTGLLGDPLKEPEAIVERLTELLKLSNVEKRILGRALQVYRDALSKSKPSDTTVEPIVWVELAREDKPLMDMLKAFIRRARGPTEKEKETALALIEQSLRWAGKPDSEKAWPSSKALMKEGFKAGPKLGIELKLRQWNAFWTLRPGS
ncbi:MAG: CCA tRNA nucleotidyltransferase [Bdellovibrionota bacterium]